MHRELGQNVCVFAENRSFTRVHNYGFCQTLDPHIISTYLRGEGPWTQKLRFPLRWGPGGQGCQGFPLCEPDVVHSIIALHAAPADRT